jgi:PPOX class probable F420-dependent enzyme
MCATQRKSTPWPAKQWNNLAAAMSGLIIPVFQEAEMTGIKQFEKQQYLNIETFRKNGNGVKTPVWFVQDHEELFVWTESSSGKAKRMKNNGHVKIVPSKPDGTPVGEWVAATARVDDSDQAMKHVRALMGKKYGLMFDMFGLLGKLRRSKYTSIQLKIPDI